MSIEKLGGNSPISKIAAELKAITTSGGNKTSNVQMTGLYKEGGVTQKDINRYLEDPFSRKEIKNLVSKSPIGLGDAPSKEELEKKGCTFAGTAYHIGAPVFYDTPDGGQISVYDGRGTNRGEDERKVVYQKGNLTQTMYYDENGKLTGGSVMVKDSHTNMVDAYTAFSVKDGNIIPSNMTIN